MGIFTAGALAQEAAPPGAGPWTADCVSAGRTASPICQMEQRVVLAATGQLLTALAIRFAGEGATPELSVQVPHGLYLPAGVTVSLGEESLLEVPLVTCDGGGCYGIAALDDAMLARLREAQEVTVTFEDVSRMAVGVPVAMLGFAEALERAR